MQEERESKSGANSYNFTMDDTDKIFNYQLTIAKLEVSKSYFYLCLSIHFDNN